MVFSMTKPLSKSETGKLVMRAQSYSGIQMIFKFNFFVIK